VNLFKAWLIQNSVYSGFDLVSEWAIVA